MTMEKRVEKLEHELIRVRRHNRRLTVTGTVLLLVMGTVMLTGWMTPPSANFRDQTLEAKGLSIFDENGTRRAWFASGGLVMCDQKGNSRAGFSSGGIDLRDENGTGRAWYGNGGLGMRDQNGKIRVGLVMTKDAAELRLIDQNEKVRVALDKTGLCLSDENGKARAALVVLKKGPSLSLSDEKGETIWSAPPSQEVKHEEDG